MPKKIALEVKKDLEAVVAEFGDARRSKLIKDAEELEIQEDAFVVKEEVFALVTADGWIKRLRQGNDPFATRVREGE